MTGLLTSLFPARRTRASRPAARKPSARLGVETLGDRIVPAVTSALSNSGVLTVAGSRASDDACVELGTGFNSQYLYVRDYTTDSSDYRVPASAVTRIDFFGGVGNDRLQNRTAIPSKFDGEGGNDTLIGGGGIDLFYGSSGRDEYTGGAGQDVLYRNGYHGYFQDAGSPFRRFDYDLTVGQVLTPAVGGLSAEELRAAGSVTASLDPADKRRLILNGPSGAAIVLKAASWTKTTSAFETSDEVKLETDVGDVLFTPALNGRNKTKVNLYGSPVSDAGNFDSITCAGAPVTGSVGDQLSRNLGGIMDAAGMILDLPDVSWGIKLGNEIQNLDSDAPLNPAVPYLYASYKESGSPVDSDLIQLNLQTTEQTHEGTIAYAPSDGTVYVAWDDYGVAVSATGYIPYTPDRTPDGFVSPDIYGDLYLRGPITVGSYTLDGEVVLDLDANGDGQSSAMTTIGDKLTRFARGLQSPSMDKYQANGFGSGILSDIAVGFNGELYKDFAEGLVTVKLSEVSALFRAGSRDGETSQFGFRASSPDPFEGMDTTQGVGKVLAKLGGVAYDIQGLVSWEKGSGDDFNWQLTASVTTDKIGGILPVAGLTLYAGNMRYNGTAFYVQAHCEVGRYGSLVLQGSIAFEGESVYLYTQVDVNKADYEGTFQSSVKSQTKITVQWSENKFTLGGSYSFDVWAKVAAVGEGRLSFDAALSLTVLDDRVYFSGRGSIEISAWVYILDWHPEASAEFSFSNTAFAIDIDGLGQVEFDW